MNILFPMTGQNRFTDEQYMYPKPLIEVGSGTMIESALRTYLEIPATKINVALSLNDVKDYNLDEVVKRIVEPASVNITVLARETAGALCTALLLAEQLDDHEELLIVNYDQHIGFDVNSVLEYFRAANAGFGVVSFESIHPKWSYVRLDESEKVIEAAEKRPISKHALAGIYYFQTSEMFKAAAKQTLLDAPSDKKIFYISDAINSCILMGFSGDVFKIPKNKYRKFYDANEVHEHIVDGRNFINSSFLTEQYAKKFHERDLEFLKSLLHDDANLYDPNVGLIVGKENIVNFLDELFKNNPNLRFKVKNIIAQKNTSMLEFELALESSLICGCDLIEWSDGKIKKLTAYLESK